MQSDNRIKNYEFGRVTIDDTQYRSDVIVYPDNVDDSWWRSEGHKLVPVDLPTLTYNKPEILIIGQGKFGFMKVTEEFKTYAKKLKVELIVEPTEVAIEKYNQLWQTGRKNIIAALHLTC